MNLLAIDASQRSFSICLRLAGQEVELLDLVSAKIEQLPELLKDLLTRHGLMPDALDRLSLISGPGSYTGLRGSLLVARSLALIAQVPVMTRRGLDVLHYEAARQAQGPVLALQSVRQDQYYFSVAQLTETDQIQLEAAATGSFEGISELQLRYDCPVIGDWPTKKDGSTEVFGTKPVTQLETRNIARILAEWTEKEFCPVPPDSLEPFYIRPAVMPVATGTQGLDEGAAQS